MINQLIRANIKIADRANNSKINMVTSKGPRPKVTWPSKRLHLNKVTAKKKATAKKRRTEDDPEYTPLTEY